MEGRSQDPLVHASLRAASTRARQPPKCTGCTRTRTWSDTTLRWPDPVIRVQWSSQLCSNGRTFDDALEASYRVDLSMLEKKAASRTCCHSMHSASVLVSSSDFPHFWSHPSTPRSGSGRGRRQRVCWRRGVGEAESGGRRPRCVVVHGSSPRGLQIVSASDSVFVRLSVSVKSFVPDGLSVQGL